VVRLPLIGIGRGHGHLLRDHVVPWPNLAARQGCRPDRGGV